MTIDAAGVVALMFFGWLGGNAAVLAVRSWLRSRSPEYRDLQARRRYMQALPSAEWRVTMPVSLDPCLVCGTQHRPWEYCPSRTTGLTGVKLDSGH